MTWSDLADWWLREIDSDPAYARVVDPLLIEVLQPMPGIYLDLGCGEGRVMRAIGSARVTIHGIDVSEQLARLAGLAVVGHMPELPMRDSVYDGVYSVLALEHVSDLRRFFVEAARVTKPGGVMALVVNHPIWTAPDSSPITDQFGEVLWRPGEYFTEGITEMPAGEGSVLFHHRSLSALLNAAAASGWSLVKMVEQPHHELEDQAGIPRLMGCRWALAKNLG